MGYQDLILSEPGLMFYYKFDGNLNDSKAGQTAVATSAIYDTNVAFPGIGANSLKVNMSTGGSFATVNLSSALAFGQNNFAVEYFFSHITSSDIGISVDYRTGPTTGWGVSDGSGQIKVILNTSQYLTHSGLIPSGWHHVIVSREYNSAVNIQVDGTIVSGVAETNNLNTSSLCVIGGRSFTSNFIFAFNGYIDELSFYSSSLTPSVMQTHWREARYFMDSHNNPWMGSQIKMRR